MTSAVSIDSRDPDWTVHGHAGRDDAPLVVHGHDLLSLMARLISDARVQDIVVRPRVREVRALVAHPSSTTEEGVES